MEKLDIEMSNEELDSLIVVYEKKLKDYEIKQSQNHRFLKKHFDEKVKVLKQKVEFFKKKRK